MEKMLQLLERMYGSVSDKIKPEDIPLPPDSEEDTEGELSKSGLKDLQKQAALLQNIMTTVETATGNEPTNSELRKQLEKIA